LSREFNVSAGLTKPRVVYKEARFAQMTVLQHLDAIVTDLVERHGWIGSTEERGGMHVVSAFVPLANLLGYMYYLRDATHGRGSFTMKLDRYEPVDDGVR